MISHFVANSEKCRKYTFLGGSAQIITISHGGVIEIYYNITWGGVFPIYYNISITNLYYGIYSRSLKCCNSRPSSYLSWGVCELLVGQGVFRFWDQDWVFVANHVVIVS